MRFRPALDRILGTNIGAKALRDVHVTRMRRETNEPTQLLFRHSAGASVRVVMFRHNRTRKAFRRYASSATPSISRLTSSSVV